MKDIQGLIARMTADARKAARGIARLSTATKNKLLLETAGLLDDRRGQLKEENAKDLEVAKEKGVSTA
ncbi:MAG: hypothetical protein ACP5J5_05155, partial [Dissulfurimicrobium sp.]